MEQMMALLELIADLEPKVSEYADILLFPRKDAKFRNERVIEKLRSKFDLVHEAKSKRLLTGWPVGPNALAMDLFQHIHGGWTRNEFTYEGVMLLESDCVPLSKDWIKDILWEWSTLKYSDGVAYRHLAMGHWDGSGLDAAKSHMNGNFVFHPELIDKVPQLAYDEVPGWGWDMKYWPLIKPYAKPSKLIYSDYRLNTIKNPWRGCQSVWEPKFHTYPDNPLVGIPLQPVWLHGCKGKEAISCVREKFQKSS